MVRRSAAEGDAKERAIHPRCESLVVTCILVLPLSSDAALETELEED